MASLPNTMKGVLIEKTGGVEVLQWKTDLPVPTPKEGEVLVKNDFIGINYIDTYFRTGLYPAPKPEILGREAEGTIVSTGSGSLHNLKTGDRVVFLGTGAYAEYTSVPAAKTHVIPSALEPGIAAASLLQGLTALTLIREAHHVQKGDWVLVHAAAGGVGLWLCQLLKAVGAKTIGTASTAEKIALAKENGATYMVNYKEEKDLVGKIKEITGGEGVRVVFDSTGKDQFENDLEIVARKGTVVSYGNSSGPVPPLAITKLSAKNLKVIRPTLFNYIYTREEFETYCAELFDFIIKDKLNVRIHETYPLQEVARAHTDLEGRKTTGKLLLKP
ncbi:putative quinone oxidoreductase [Lachnellula suecica]|uniref:Probable quinone oxidoreductase n=1 Tax=Lachnellula suecica TaxID=602035 RepID=A0A8T9CKI1_9HELO|nr:putative quinone oxidoreductase [Lachnellula suecica]